MANAEKILLVLPSDKTDPQEHESTRESIKKLQKIHLEPVYITVDMDPTKQDEKYASTSGVLLAGGLDINPKYFNQNKHPATNLDEKRDIVEMRIVKKTLRDKKPLLGICRGMQIMAVVNGGDLIQHISDVTSEKHGRSTDDPQAEHVVHDVLVKPGTKAHAIFSTDRIKDAPSRHHQAVDNPGKLLISGVSPNSDKPIVEIVEHPTLPFHIGIQTHPEYTDSMDVIFDAFAEAVNIYQKQTKPLAA